MSHLLAISVGPVQEFIAAARRTADLQAGSRLLIGAAQAAARTIDEAGGVLIFPADAATEGPNKVLAEIRDADPAAVAAAAEEAARAFLRRAWAQDRDRIPAGALDEELASNQLDGFLEIYAAWWPLDGDYPAARTAVERLLAGRKTLRDFNPPLSRAGVPKSPLDPSRDCALRSGAGFSVPENCTQAPLRLKSRETLDAVSLLKRLRGESGVPSTSLMAVRWALREMEEKAGDAVARLREMAASTSGALDLGDLFFPQRLDPEELSAHRLDAGAIDRLREEALAAVGLREAPAYYAILWADGDRMGRLIGEQATRARHQDISRALAQFAAEARRLVVEADGHAVYCGGDDVLALLPAGRAIGLSLALMETFRARLEPFGTDRARPRLSAGLAFVHHMEMLNVSLERARAAGRAAKQERDSLAVALHPRGGEGMAVALRADAAAQAWEEWPAAFRAGLARGLPYELRVLAREWARAAMPALRLRAEVERICARKEGGGDRQAPAWVQDAASLESFARLLAIARFLTGQEGRHG